jgi:hypothetical protein
MMNFLKGKSKGDVVFTIYRDSGEDAFLNRIAKDKATDVIPRTGDNADECRKSNTSARPRGRPFTLAFAKEVMTAPSLRLPFKTARREGSPRSKWTLGNRFL